MRPKGHTVIGAPIVRHRVSDVLDEVTVIAGAISTDLVKLGWLVTNGQRRKFVHVRIYRELVLVEKINAPCS